MARLVCLALLLPHANSQMDGLPKKAKPSPIDGDIKYIRCQTCELMVAKALEQAKAVAAAEQPKPQQKRRFQAQENLGGLEGSIEDIVTSICDSESVGDLPSRRTGDIAHGVSQLTPEQRASGCPTTTLSSAGQR